MNQDFSLSTRNMIIAMLSEALLGAISPNFRRVSLCSEDKHLTVLFLLEHEDSIDREEAEDAVGEFGALLEDVEDSINSLGFKIIVDSGPLKPLGSNKCVHVFLRREAFS